MIREMKLATESMCDEEKEGCMSFNLILAILALINALGVSIWCIQDFIRRRRWDRASAARWKTGSKSAERNTCQQKVEVQRGPKNPGLYRE